MSPSTNVRLSETERDVLRKPPPVFEELGINFAQYEKEEKIEDLSRDDLKIVLASKEEEIDVIARELQGRKRLRGMDYYVPNKMQYEGHRSLASTVLLCAGNRSGKSTFGAMEVCFHVTRNYPDWCPYERRFKRPVKVVISATEFPIVGRVIEPKLMSLLPHGYFKVKRSPQGYMTKVMCADGSTIDVLTLEMSDLAYESADWDFVWEDEPQHKGKREAILRGLVDRNGKEVITFTPLAEPWMKDELIDKADGKNIAVFYASIYDNQSDIQGNKILEKASIDRFVSGISEDFKESRVSGVFFTVRGLVYKEFSDDHLVSCNHPNLFPAECSFHYQYPDPVICVLDPHDRQPHHIIWAYIDRQDDIFVDYELSVHCELDELAKMIKRIEKDRGYKMRKRLIDPNFGRKPAASGSNVSVKQELARHGVGFYEPSDDVELGHMIVRDYLHFDKSKPITAINKPKIFFAKDRVPLTIKSMRNLQYQEWQGKTKDDKDPKEVEKDKDNHGADDVRYLCITKPSYNFLTEDFSQYELAESPY